MLSFFLPHYTIETNTKAADRREAGSVGFLPGTCLVLAVRVASRRSPTSLHLRKGKTKKWEKYMLSVCPFGVCRSEADVECFSIIFYFMLIV